MTKQEAFLKRTLFRTLHEVLPRFITLLHATAGAPDRSITGNGYTSMWEFKHGTPGFKSPDNQELMMCRLQLQGHHVRYVVWLEDANGQNKRTLIVKPSTIKEGLVTPELSYTGFNHLWLIEQIKSIHGLQ